MANQGEKFTIAELIPPRPFLEDNCAPELLEAIRQIGQSRLLIVLRPPSMQFVAPGKAIVARELRVWRTANPTPIFIDPTLARRYGLSVVSNSVAAPSNGFTADHWEAVGVEFQKISPSLVAAKNALRKPAFDPGLNYNLGLDLSVPHLARMKELAQAFSAATMYELHQGHLEEALGFVEAILLLSGKLHEERLLISQFARAAMVDIAFAKTWEAIQALGWNDGQLSRLQKAWESSELMTALARSLEMQRANEIEYYDRCRHSRKAMTPIQTGQGGLTPRPMPSLFSKDGIDFLFKETLPGVGKNLIFIPIWQIAWSQQEELANLTAFQKILEEARQLAARKMPLKDVVSISLEDNFEFEPTTPYDRWRFLLAYNRLSAAARRGILVCGHLETKRALAKTAIALRRFQIRHGQFSSDLASLVPEFLQELPRDFMDGKPLRYQLNQNGTFLLYSVGKDGRDDGGNPNPPANKGSSTRLWDGLDFVWPLPASTEEIVEMPKRIGKGGALR